MIYRPPKDTKHKIFFQGLYVCKKQLEFLLLYNTCFMQVKDSSHDCKTEGKYRVAYVDTVMCFSVQMVFH